MSFINALNHYAQGTDPTVTRLVLGNFEFLEFEVPERITLAGRQKTVQHQMIGGQRVIDVLGTEYDPLSWSGVITGNHAGERVSALERMRDEGRPLILLLDTYRFTVVITAFNPVYEFVWRRPYSLEVAIVSNNGSPQKTDALSGALQRLIDSDIGRALGLASIIDVEAVADAVKTLHDSVKQVSDFAHATVDQIQTVIRPLIAARNIIQHELALLEAAAGEITSLGGLIPGNPIDRTVRNLLAQLDHATRIPALYRLQDVLGRLDKNVNAGQTAEGIKTITLSGGNLYQVAAEEYGDVTLWPDIAAINELDDPQLTGIQTLTVPLKPADKR